MTWVILSLRLAEVQSEARVRKAGFPSTRGAWSTEQLGKPGRGRRSRTLAARSAASHDGHRAIPAGSDARCMTAVSELALRRVRRGCPGHLHVGPALSRTRLALGLAGRKHRSSGSEELQKIAFRRAAAQTRSRPSTAPSTFPMSGLGEERRLSGTKFRKFAARGLNTGSPPQNSEDVHFRRGIFIGEFRLR